MKKLSNNNGVIKSSTLAGQRELLREYRNKTNEIIDCVSKLEQREAQHELDVITSMQYLEKRIEELEKDLKSLTTEVHVNLDQPYTAMRSTGERIADEQERKEKQMKEDIRVVLDEFWMNGKEAGYLMKYDNVITTDTIIDRILAIVKGE